MEKIKGKRRYIAKVGEKKLLSLPAIADLIGERHMTVYRWVTKKHDILHKLGVEVFRDTSNGHYYMTEASIEKLKNRFVSVN